MVPLSEMTTVSQAIGALDKEQKGILIDIIDLFGRIVPQLIYIGQLAIALMAMFFLTFLANAIFLWAIYDNEKDKSESFKIGYLVGISIFGALILVGFGLIVALGVRYTATFLANLDDYQKISSRARAQLSNGTPNFGESVF